MSAPKKQTAIEWLMDKLPHSIECWYSKQIEQAKAMEREQMMDAYEQGESDGYKQFVINIDKKYQSAEQYYNETYETI